MLPPIAIEENAEIGTGPVSGYSARQSVTATKTDTPVLETPQSLSIVTRDQITAQQDQTLVEALRYTPGVTLDAFSANTFFDSATIRGFPAARYLDGLRLPLDPGTQFAAPRIEPYGLERLEVLKGPSSGLYGQSDPGGLINMVSKRPTATPHNEIVGQYGSFDRYQGAFDLSGPIDRNARFQYRLTGLGRDSDTQIDFVEDNKLFLAPSFTWRPTSDTRFTLLTQYQYVDNKGFQQFVPAQGSLLFNPNGRIPFNRYIGEPGVDGFRLNQYAAGYSLEHSFSDMLQFRQNLRYTSVRNDLTGVRDEGLQADLRTANRSVNYVLADAQDFAVDNQLQADFDTAPLRHRVLAGVDYLRQDSHSDFRSAAAPPIDVFNPVYGAPVPGFASATQFILSDNAVRQTGIYLQDQVKLDRWTLTLTGRHDWVTTETENLLLPATGDASQDDTAFTGRVGLNYLFDFGLAPYVSYSTSFVPQTGTDIAGRPFVPTEGEGKEVGVKYRPPGMNLLLTASVFEITQKNVLTADPTNPFFSVQTGEDRVRGGEIEVRGNLTPELEIVGGYSRLDPKVTEDNGGNAGRHIPNVARDQASLWAMYTFHQGPLAGLGLGGGVRYVGESFGDAANTIRIPSFTLYDAALTYDLSSLDDRLKGVSAQLNATNLADQYYVASCVTSTAFCGLGAGRRILLTLRYAWE